MSEDFFARYLSYTAETESPAIFHRWAAIVSLGAFLGRQYYFQHGHFTIYSNMYCMLIGSPGTRKGTAIKLAKALLTNAGYSSFAAERTSKEKFLLDLSGEGADNSIDSILDKNLFGDDTSNESREIFIAIDEINDFLGNGNIEFISMLGNMWDYSGVYKNRIKTGKSVDIPNPTISMIGGNTPTGFNLAFPADILGQGFFSRLLLIYGESNGKRIPFPPKPDAVATSNICEFIREIKSTVFGPAKLTGKAEKLLERIYSSNISVDDVRFESYSTRRFTHLIKLCLVVSANRKSTEITESDVIYAHTILSYTEQFMPRALGEFGKAKNSDISHKVYQVICEAAVPIKFKEIWKHVHADLEKMTLLQEILINLMEADKIQVVKELGAYLPKKRALKQDLKGMIDYSLLTQEEREKHK